MTAPLYDVKARLSEYITMAEEGEVIEITKHGNISSVIISLKTFNELKKNNKRPNFIESLKKWRQETGGIDEETWLEWQKGCERSKETYDESRLAGIWD